jgi:putative DNA primase/helicase
LAYFAAGSPAIDAPRSRFEDWDRFVRRPLLWLGCTDPLKTQADLRSADPVREGLLAVLHAWRDAFGTGDRTVNDCTNAARGVGQSGKPQLLEALQAVAGERDGTINARRLGRYLTRNLRRIEDGLRLEDAGEDATTHRKKFKVSGVTGVIGVSANPLQEKEKNIRSETNANNACYAEDDF